MPDPVPSLSARERITQIFDREIALAVADHEPSEHMEWLKSLRDEVLEVLADRGVS